MLVLVMKKFDYLMVKLVKNKKIIIEDKRYYLRKFYEAEKYICERLCFLNDMSINSNISIDKYINNKEKDDKIKYDEIQKKAIYSGVNNNITIITGGPELVRLQLLRQLLIFSFMKKKKKKMILHFLLQQGELVRNLWKLLVLVLVLFINI